MSIKSRLDDLAEHKRINPSFNPSSVDIRSTREYVSRALDVPLKRGRPIMYKGLPIKCLKISKRAADAQARKIVNR